MALTQILGKRGEDLAVNYLEAEGYQIVKRNFRLRSKHEIDIIALRHGLLVFVEVKTRKNSIYGEPFEQVNSKKEKIISNTADLFLKHFKQAYEDIRFDIISIVMTDHQAKLKHIESAFHPTNF